MADQSEAASYIHTVQHLIEECILFDMSKQECMDALSKHANIQPLITSTVWDELEKENKEFFSGYVKSIKTKDSIGTEHTSDSESSSTQNGNVKGNNAQGSQ